MLAGDAPETILVTGGFGCIGAETVKWIERNSNATVVVGSREVSEARTKRVFHDIDHSRLVFVPLDVRDQSQLEQVIGDHSVSRVVHLAALQTPDCNNYRDLGLQINLGGTQNLIEAMKSNSRDGTGPDIKRFVYASSVAVYGPRAIYPAGPVPTAAEPKPVNVYGVWKLAGEQIAEFFHADTGISTLSLRPGVLFGPGRDAGLTASPTTAMKAVALGLPYEIPFRSRQDYLFAADVGAAFGNAVLAPHSGYGAFTLPNLTIDSTEFEQTLRQVATEVGLGEQYQITVGEEQVPFICDLEYESFLQSFPDAPRTPLIEAIRQSLLVFQQQVERGWLTPNSIN
jgi:nucleoside-diphosphate-sugar epimerase